jgi:hypothetical protein
MATVKPHLKPEFSTHAKSDIYLQRRNLLVLKVGYMCPINRFSVWRNGQKGMLSTLAGAIA